MTRGPDRDGPTERQREAALAFGLVIEADEPPTPAVCEVWPENWTAVEIFRRIGVTQWSHGPAGPVGLRHEVVPMYLDLMGVPKEERLETMDAIRIMEYEALRLLREMRTH